MVTKRNHRDAMLDYDDALDLLQQEHAAALHELLADRTLTISTRRVGMKRLRDEFLQRCAQEREREKKKRLAAYL